MIKGTIKFPYKCPDLKFKTSGEIVRLNTLMGGSLFYHDGDVCEYMSDGICAVLWPEWGDDYFQMLGNPLVEKVIEITN